MNIDSERLEELCRKLKPVMVEAAASIMEVYEDDASFGVNLKEDNSPVTKADIAANDIICRFLKEITPEIMIISEENKSIDFETRKGERYIWMVDPLDGTKEFIKRNGEFTVNVALLEYGKPILGLVHMPTEDKLYTAIKSKGAYLDNEQLKVQKYSIAEKGLRVVSSRSHINAETQKYIDRLDTPVIVARGSSIKFICIAAGEADFYPRIAPTMEWDTAAAQIILEEAGGQLLQVDTLEPLEYNKEDLLNPSFLATADVLEGIESLVN